MASIQHKRREALLFQEVALIVTEKIENSNISMPTVTGVKLSMDQSVLKVYITFSKNQKRSFQHLEKARGFVRSQLAKVASLRKVPAIVFENDETLNKAHKIEQILKKINS